MHHDLFFAIWHDAMFDRIYQVTASETQIGRRKENSLCLPDPAVSRDHAIVFWADSNYCIRDLGSRNGTSVNGRPVRGDTILHKDADIQIGPYRLRAIFDLAAAQLKTEVSEESTISGGTRDTEYDLEARVQRLTPAQRRVYEAFLQGLSEKEIACELDVSVNTVHSHSRAIYTIFEVNSRPELLARCAMHSVRQHQQDRHRGGTG